MKQGIGFPLIVCGIFGILGLLVMPANALIGGAMVLIASLAVWFATHGSRGKKPVQPSMTVAFEPKMRQLTESTPPYDRQKVNALIYVLNQAKINAYEPVLLSDEDTPALTVKDLLIEMVRMAEERGTFDALQNDIVKIYQQIGPNVAGALEQYQELYLIKTYLARKAMVDIQMNPEAEPE